MMEVRGNILIGHKIKLSGHRTRQRETEVKKKQKPYLERDGSIKSQMLSLSK